MAPGKRPLRNALKLPKLLGTQFLPSKTVAGVQARRRQNQLIQSMENLQAVYQMAKGATVPMRFTKLREVYCLLNHNLQ